MQNQLLFFRRLATKETLRLHLSTHSDATPFACYLCPKRYKQKRPLKLHMKNHHGVTFQAENQLNGDDENDRDDDDSLNMVFTCDECHSEFTSIAGLNQHKQNHERGTRFRCAICSMDFSIKYQYFEHMNTHSSILLFPCKYCWRKFTKETSLIAHENRHKQGQEFACTKCSKSFAVKGSLNRHMREHTEVNGFKCEVCSKIFNNKYNLNAHMRFQHAGEKPVYRCVHCKKTYETRNRLEFHKKSHLNEAAYSHIQPEIVTLNDDE